MSTPTKLEAAVSRGIGDPATLASELRSLGHYRTKSVADAMAIVTATAATPLTSPIEASARDSLLSDIVQLYVQAEGDAVRKILERRGGFLNSIPSSTRG